MLKLFFRFSKAPSLCLRNIIMNKILSIGNLTWNVENCTDYTLKAQDERSIKHWLDECMGERSIKHWLRPRILIKR